MQKIYQIRIALRHITPPIWRRIEVSADTDLATFSQLILNAMGWDGYHLMSFDIGGEEYHQDEESVADFGGELMSNVNLHQCFTAEKQKGLFTYDFGDNWEHEVLLEKILDPESGVKYPRCTAGKRACPPEDCGGPWGYMGLLEAIQDPKHPEHEDMLEWVGGEFDAEEFDVEEVNGGW
jgi:Plasmid pRiA4b ORF-3-like protein